MAVRVERQNRMGLDLQTAIVCIFRRASHHPHPRTKHMQGLRQYFLIDGQDLLLANLDFFLFEPVWQVASSTLVSHTACPTESLQRTRQSLS